ETRPQLGPGQETRPQLEETRPKQGSDALCHGLPTVPHNALWHGLPTVPQGRTEGLPKHSETCGRRSGRVRRPGHNWRRPGQNRRRPGPNGGCPKHCWCGNTYCLPSSTSSRPGGTCWLKARRFGNCLEGHGCCSAGWNLSTSSLTTSRSFL